MRRRLAQQISEAEGEAIAEIDRMVEQNEATLEIDDETINSPESRKKQKVKATKEEVQADIMKGIQGVADAIIKATEALVMAQTSSTELLVKAHTSKLSMPAKEIRNLVVELDLDPSVTNVAYRFLIQNLDMLEAVLGCPFEQQNDFLMDLI